MATLLTVAQIKRLGVCKNNLYASMADGSLPFKKVGAHRLVRDRDLLDWLAGKPEKAEAAAVEPAR